MWRFILSLSSHITGQVTMYSPLCVLILLGSISVCSGESDFLHGKWFRPAELLRMTLRRDARVCGKQIIPPRLQMDKNTGQPQIVGGGQAEPNSWPWMATLKNEQIGSHWCSGVLIAYKWVLTAAHCFNRPFNGLEEWTIRLGKHNAFTNETDEEIHKVRRRFIHPLYDNKTYDHDIALLEMEETMDLYTEKVLPLCTPGKRKVAKTGDHCVIAGWGDTKGTANPLFLNQAVVPVVDNTVCMGLHGDRVTENMMCAGYAQGGTDSCQGDSGGPLMCLQKGGNKWYVAGITSWGDGCGKKWKPGVYTKVSNYRRWITDTIKLYAFI